MKVRLLLAAACALLASTTTQAQVTAAPNCTAGTLASYIALGAGGCLFESTLYRDFTYAAPVSTTITPAQILVIPSLGVTAITPYPGLTFYAPWSVAAGGSLTSIIGYNTVPFPPIEIGATDLTLDLGTASVGGIIGSVAVTETATPASSALPVTLEVYEICEDACRLQKTATATVDEVGSFTHELTVTLTGGTGGASLNYFTANQSYGVLPE